MILSRRRRATIRKNLLIGDLDLCRAPGSYPRGSSSGAVYLDVADPQPLHYAVTHGPSSSITNGRETRLQAFLGSLPIGCAPHLCNQPTMTL
ncbi:hypothetical protein X777_16710 [Ooceraea biroi]|uniref:Uncharacterized protein n=1 Tax=Ooceraea biroi TaxID=2015173 RepID=A0A026VTD5_OOCBI|nr:hypothetical protein X777_16710 [Ooceraea biroi]